MKNVPIIVSIILLLIGIALMLGDFAFEAALPDWTSRLVVGVGVLLMVISTFMKRSAKAG